VDDLSQVELAALAHTWEAWARPKQVPPATSWRSWGFVAGRGNGKTRSCTEFILDEVAAGRARRIGFCSFNLDEAERTLVNGVSGLLTLSPPWFKPEWSKGQLFWPNGAIATAFTPEVPNGPRGPEHDLFWCSEVAAWPASGRDEFFKNIREGLRLGLGRMIYDTTPRARHPLVRFLLERAAHDPARHVVVRGATRDNADNLTADFVQELVSDYGGTQRARQELEGEFFDDAEGALFRQAWIDAARRDVPTTLKRRIIFVDPAISTRSGTDATGIVDAGLGIDDQVYVFGDHTKRMAPEVWGALLIELYLRHECDCIGVERNRGGDLVAANIRASAAQRGLRVEVVGPDALTRHHPSTVYVKETVARKGKAVRAEPVSTLYERGRVSHVRGADLSELEDVMTTWLPESGGDSPNALDALVYAVVELAGLARESKPDGKAAISGAVKMQEQIAAAPRPKPTGIAALLLSGGRGGTRI